MRVSIWLRVPSLLELETATMGKQCKYLDRHGFCQYGCIQFMGTHLITCHRFARGECKYVGRACCRGLHHKPNKPTPNQTRHVSTSRQLVPTKALKNSTRSGAIEPSNSSATGSSRSAAMERSGASESTGSLELWVVTAEPLPELMKIKPRKPKLWVYLDYNGVLNKEGTESLEDFILLVHSFRTDVSLDIILLSKAMNRSPYCCNVTCNEIADTGVLNVFTKLVFTTDRCAAAETLRHPCKVEQFKYWPLSPRLHPGLPEVHTWSRPAPVETIQDEDTSDEFRRRQRREFKEVFHFFYGGKDQFIYSQHTAEMLTDPESPDRIIFVDDKSENLEAVDALNRLQEFRGSVRCVEMRRKSFRTGSWAYHTHNLKELYILIQDSVQQLVDDHDGATVRQRCVQNAIAQQWNTCVGAIRMR